jgi:antirestriction protein ArdC
MHNCPLIKHQGNEACYVPSRDYVNMPGLNRFENSKAYYRVLFHELVHSTGHQNRIGRKEVYDDPDFGTEEYSLEELVAEMGACYLQSYAGVPLAQLDNSAAYIQNWLQVFEGDSQFVIKAASYAQRAVDYILKPPKEEMGSNMSNAERYES